MKNEIPTIRSNDSMTFVRLGRDEEIDMTLDRKTNHMSFRRAIWNEEIEDWDDTEVYLEDVQDELEKYAFCTIAPKPLTIRQLAATFSFKMAI